MIPIQNSLFDMVLSGAASHRAGSSDAGSSDAGPTLTASARAFASRLVTLGISAAVAAAVAFSSTGARALGKGDTVNTVKVKDSKDKDAEIPDFGKKVLAIFYTDPDVKDQNEPFRDMLNTAGLDPAKMRGLGVVNMKDTWLANAIIRSAVRSKEKKFNSLILTDPDHLLAKAWNLGDCDGKDVVVVVDKERKVQFYKAGKMSADEMKKTLELIRELSEK